MKSLLALGLIVFAIFACKTSNKNINVNTNTGSNRPANAEVYVDQVHMAKDDNDEPGESATTFSPSDHKVHVVITLNKAKAGTQVRAIWIAANVAGETNKQLKSLDYTTNSAEKTISGYLRWPQDWPTGDYRVEIYINGVLDKTINYTIQ